MLVILFARDLDKLISSSAKSVENQPEACDQDDGAPNSLEPVSFFSHEHHDWDDQDSVEIG